MSLLRLTVSVILFLTVLLGSPLVSGFNADQVAGIAQAAERIDINTAKTDELKALPGIGDAFSERIIKGRPYKRKDELVQKKIIPQATYDTIKDQIVARQN